jgi:tetratricopeptide (TPR) repeat protein
MSPPLQIAELVPQAGSQQLLDVPFFPQTAYQCGPAALAGLLAASGVDTSAAELEAQVYLPGRQGSLQLELLGATRRAGRIPYVLQQHPSALLAEIAGGRPVLVLQNLRTPSFPAWHYAVLTGFDPASNTVLLNSGAQRHARVSAKAFLRTWNWGGRWAMITLRPGELPVDADEGAYSMAVVDFEAVADRDSAASAWRAALAAWPQNPLPWLALGNLAYRHGALEQAAAHYRAGLLLRASDPGLGNNLATVLGELGCARAGEQLLQTLLAGLDASSPWHATIRATQQELAMQPGDDGVHCRALASGD